jgi:hypothetical protein
LRATFPLGGWIAAASDGCALLLGGGDGARASEAGEAAQHHPLALSVGAILQDP